MNILMDGHEKIWNIEYCMLNMYMYIYIYMLFSQFVPSVVSIDSKRQLRRI